MMITKPNAKIHRQQPHLEVVAVSSFAISMALLVATILAQLLR